MSWYKSSGVILKRFGAIAVSDNCCCCEPCCPEADCLAELTATIRAPGCATIDGVTFILTQQTPCPGPGNQEWINELVLITPQDTHVSFSARLVCELPNPEEPECWKYRFYMRNEAQASCVLLQENYGAGPWGTSLRKEPSEKTCVEGQPFHLRFNGYTLLDDDLYGPCICGDGFTFDVEIDE